jgi:propanol-preferring alcohol dehydrogenase
MPEIQSFEKRVGLHSGVFRIAVLHALDLPLASPPKPLWSAKVRLKGIQVRGSFLGTRQDLADALRLAASGKVKPHVETHPLDRTPELLDRLRNGAMIGRAVIVF